MKVVRTALWLALVWLLSLLVAFAIAVGLAVSFNSGEEFIAVQFLLVIYSFVAIAAMGAAYLFGKSVRVLAIVAFGLGAAAFLLAIFPAVVDALQMRGADTYRFDMRKNAELL